MGRFRLQTEVSSGNGGASNGGVSSGNVPFTSVNGTLPELTPPLLPQVLDQVDAGLAGA
jgi:hypothetical protein